jgi:Uma2 family endonuclease
MSIARKVHYTYDEYLGIEQRSDVRHEYLGGEIYAMAGGTPQHAYLAGQLIALLSRGLPAGCRVASSDLKISIEASGLYTYPDAVVVCGADRPDVRDPNAVTNPVLIAEVTSTSTEDYDRGAKLAHYQQIEALQSVLIVSHRRRCLTVVSRSPDGWVSRDFEAGTTAELAGPVKRLAVDEVYATFSALGP